LAGGDDAKSHHVGDRAKNFKRNGAGTPFTVTMRRRLQGGKLMRILSYKAALVVALTLCFIPLNASLGAGRLQVVAFGDSLLDAGTYSPFASVTFGGGRFTTNPGRNFTQDVALHYGDKLTPAFLGGFGLPLFPTGGLDYAQGGSRVALQPGIGHAPPGTKNAAFAEATTIPVKDQVSAYLWDHKRFTSNQLVLINGGANDVFFQLQIAATQQAVLEAITKAAADLATLVATVIANGATHVAVMTLPDIGTTPLGVTSSDHGQLLTKISQLFNSTLKAAFPQNNFGGRVILIDAFSFIDGVIANYRMYGFAVSNAGPNQGMACNLAAQVTRAKQLGLPDPSGFAVSLFCSPKTYWSYGADQTFMFADTVHPTTHLGALFALFVEQQIAARGWGWDRIAESVGN
jgi:phospholipase/lecithinase/hemolysin